MRRALYFSAPSDAKLSSASVRGGHSLAAARDGIPLASAIVAAWVFALQRTPLAGSVRSHANASYPGASDPHAAATDAGSSAASVRAAVALSRHAQDDLDAAAHVRQHLAALLSAVADALAARATSGGTKGDARAGGAASSVGTASSQPRRASNPDLAARGAALLSVADAAELLRAIVVTPDEVAASHARGEDAVLPLLLALSMREGLTGSHLKPNDVATVVARAVSTIARARRGAVAISVRGLRRATHAEVAPPDAVSAAAPAQRPPFVHVSDVAESTVLICRPLAGAAVVGCTRSTIMLGPAANHVSLEGCHDCIIVVAGAHVTLHNCVEVEVALWSGSPPLLIGDCRGVRLGPYSARYSRLRAHAQAVGLLPPPLQRGSAPSAAPPQPSGNAWAHPVVSCTGAAVPSATPPASDGGDGELWSTLPPSAFMLRGGVAAPVASAHNSAGTTTPDVGYIADDVLPIPQLYEDELRRRAASTATLQAALGVALAPPPPPTGAKAPLDGGGPEAVGAHEAAAGRLQAAVLSLFSDWLRETGEVHRLAALMRGVPDGAAPGAPLGSIAVQVQQQHLAQVAAGGDVLPVTRSRSSSTGSNK